MTVRSRAASLLPVLVLVALSSGCWFGTGSTADVRWQVTGQTGMQLEPEFGMKAGRITMGLARFGMSLAGDDDDASIALKGVSKIELGVYNVVGETRSHPGITRLELPGWTPIVRVRERGEDLLVLLETVDGKQKIKAMMVLVQDEHELLVIRARGKIHKLIRKTLKQHGVVEVHESFGDSIDAS